ncbi:hypothetical protein BOTBODRAFT_44744 [Botryobasidium botryosum FD-172 SS1]|uniref:MYND-type domain-containing protein n=1 Tax=Botryobasidium botryosum (strain FD-172 SS1) TaxID=930990 RepID=A0A067MF55_BOTB1|nr:hypothetical protein BOTBODRAFT_44744 [Botryobasidium botryosum FD-172 SS1]
MELKVTCSFCSKKSNAENLPTCARCRDCQVAHFCATHKADCQGFKYPPLTDLFNIENRPGTKYAVNPVFAAGSEDSIGCWVSIGDKISCTPDSILSQTAAFPDRADIIAEPKTTGILERQKGDMKSILTLHILVQNCRRDRATVVIYSHASTLMMKDSIRGLSLRMWKGLGIGSKMAHLNQYLGNDTFPRLTTPFTKVPLDKVQDPTKGVVVLGYGDFAILELQF